MENIHEILKEYELEVPADKKAAFDKVVTLTAPQHIRIHFLPCPVALMLLSVRDVFVLFSASR